MKHSRATIRYECLVSRMRVILFIEVKQFQQDLLKNEERSNQKKIHFGKSNKRNTVYNNIHKYKTVNQQIITIEKNKQNALRKANLQQQQQRQTTQLTQLCLSKIFRSVIRNPF